MERLEDTRQPDEQVGLERMREAAEIEVDNMQDKELIEYIKDYQKLENRFYDFIMGDLRLTYCKMQGIDPKYIPTKLGGIPNLLIELFQPENYLDYFWDLVPDQQKACRELVIEFIFERMQEREE